MNRVVAGFASTTVSQRRAFNSSSAARLARILTTDNVDEVLFESLPCLRGVERRANGPY
jgi:hypothetical protein